MPKKLGQSLLIAIFACGLSSAAQASSEAAYYTATLDQPSAHARAIAGGVVWHCEGTECSAAKGRDRPLRVCSELSGKVGKIATFSAAGKALDEAKLAKCNR